MDRDGTTVVRFCPEACCVKRFNYFNLGFLSHIVEWGTTKVFGVVCFSYATKRYNFNF